MTIPASGSDAFPRRLPERASSVRLARATRATLAALALWAGGLAGQEPPAEEPGDAGRTAASRSGVVRGTVGLRLMAGSFAYEPGPELPDLEGAGFFAAGLSVFADPDAWIGLDLEMSSVMRSYPNDFRDPFLGSVDDDTSLETTMISLGLRVRGPASAPVQGYVSGGVGYIRHEMKVRGIVLIFPDTLDEDTAQDFRPYVGLGLDSRFGSWGGSLDYRRFATEGAFGSPFDVPSTELGGSVWSLGAAWYPGG